MGMLLVKKELWIPEHSGRAYMVLEHFDGHSRVQVSMARQSYLYIGGDQSFLLQQEIFQ